VVRSHWLEEALAEERDDASTPPLEGDSRADVCIVGGGYTGLWTALRLKEADPAIDVAVLEADICGGGASGRNGGMVLSWWAKFETLEKLCGTEEAIRLAKASEDAVREIGALCSAHGIRADYRYDGWLWVATSPAQNGAWAETMAVLESHGLTPFRVMDGQETQKRCASPVHLTGVFEDSAATVQPAKLARGLRRVALERGVRIHERSAMRDLVDGARPTVRTGAGSLRADKVVLAINAWGVRFPELRKAMVVVSSDMIVTEPLPERLRDIGWTTGLGISDSRMLVHYYRTTTDGRIAFGKGGGGGTLGFGSSVGQAFEGESRYQDYLRRWLEFTFPGLRGVRCPRTWTGPIDRSRSAMPLFGSLRGRPQVFFAIGFSGNGIGPTAVAGRILASLALGRKDEWSACGLVRRPTRDFPPEPMRYVGGKLVQEAVRRRDQAEDEGRKPGVIVQALAALAPAGLSPVKKKSA
jgi:putative aminophosphonate oxidoreductase